MENDPGALGAVMLMVFGAACFVGYAVLAFICWLLSSWLAKIPPEHRKQEPGMVWLLLIPLFNLVWNFFVFPRMAESFESYFRSKNDPVDCGKSLATTFCIMAACGLVVGFIPFLGMLYQLAVLVVFILVLVKFHALKTKIAPG